MTFYVSLRIFCTIWSLDTWIWNQHCQATALSFTCSPVITVKDVYDYLRHWLLGDAAVTFTHLPLVLHICISESGQHRFRQWLVAYAAPSHYLNQGWVIVNWTLRNKLQWNFNKNTKRFIHENASENIVCEMVAILSWGRYLLSISQEIVSRWMLRWWEVSIGWDNGLVLLGNKPLPDEMWTKISCSYMASQGPNELKKFALLQSYTDCWKYSVGLSNLGFDMDAIWGWLNVISSLNTGKIVPAQFSGWC